MNEVLGAEVKAVEVRDDLGLLDFLMFNLDHVPEIPTFANIEMVLFGKLHYELQLYYPPGIVSQTWKAPEELIDADHDHKLQELVDNIFPQIVETSLTTDKKHMRNITRMLLRAEKGKRI